MQDLQGHLGIEVAMETLWAWQAPQAPAPIWPRLKCFFAYKREQTELFEAINRSNDGSPRRQVLDQNGDESRKIKASVGNELPITEVCEQSLYQP